MLSRLALSPAAKLTTSIAVRAFAHSAMSVTYSGGHAQPDQQGGFYASHRPNSHPPKDYHPQKSDLVAMESDVIVVKQIMEEVQLLESLLENESLEKSIQTRGSIKKLVTSHPFVDCLSRLECVKGEPIWGLSMDERELVAEARNKMNQS